MVAAWLATVTVLPALVGARSTSASAPRAASPPPVTAFSELVARIATQRAAQLPRRASALLTVASVLPLPRYLQRSVRVRLPQPAQPPQPRSGAALLAQRVDPIFGAHPHARGGHRRPARAHRRDPQQGARARPRAARARRSSARCTTLDDFLPGDAGDAAAASWRVLAELREHHRLARGAARRRRRCARDLQELRPPDDLRRVDRRRPAARGAAARSPRTTARIGRVVLVYHDEHVSVWDGRNLMRIADIIGEIPLDDGTVVRTLGPRGDLRGHDPLDRARRAAGDARVASLAVSLLVIALARSRARRGAGARHARRRRPVDARRRGVGRRAHQLPQLHRAADHLRHRRRLRHQHLPALSARGARARRPRGARHRRRGRALLADHDHRLRRAARRRQPGAALVRRDGHPRRGRLPGGGGRRHAGVPRLARAARAARSDAA